MQKQHYLTPIKGASSRQIHTQAESLQCS